MSNKFSKHLLFNIRNSININSLIQDTLKMPSKHCDGYLRFLCPVCSDFNTATNPSTNLARCFRCNKNFNPIDLVMSVTGTNFRETVTFLSPLLK